MLRQAIGPCRGRKVNCPFLAASSGLSDFRLQARYSVAGGRRLDEIDGVG
jgi:hypothetical protein